MPKRLKHKYHTENDPVAPNSIFVFTSNLAGLHREIYSQPAATMYGAQHGTSFGYAGRSYAIPVKDRFMRPLSLLEIRRSVEAFKDFTLTNPEYLFHVVRIENALNCYKTHQIAPLFKGCSKNCAFPMQWKPYLK